MARIDVSRLDEGGAAKPTVNPVSKAPTSGAISNQFKPYVTPAPTTSNAFIGPTVPKAYGANNTPAYQPATAASVAPKSTPAATTSTYPTPSAVTQVTSSKATPKATPKPTPSVSYVPPTPPVVKKPAPVKNLVPYVNPKIGPSDTVMSFDSTVTADQRAKQKASAAAAKDMAFELTGIPSAYRLATGKNEPVFGSAAAGTALDVVGLVPFVGAAGKAAKLAGGLGKTAKEVGAANAAFKGAQHLKDKAGPQFAAGLAATTLALGPTAAPAASTAGKALTSISQSITAGSKAADVFTPGAASASKTTKATKAVENVKAPKTKTKADSLNPAAVKKASDATLATGLAGAATNAVTKADVASTAAASAAKAGDTTQTTTVNPKTTKADDSTKTKVDDTQSKIDFNGKIGDWDKADNVINTVTQATRTIDEARTGNESGSGKPSSNSKPGGKPKPRVIPVNLDDKNKEDMKRKRRWTPSAVV